ncbi:nitrate- and nitrite sensing domain-containing protein [Dactylosporangium cerinum]|uniref:histidine kinase n=1 Tax=Dactylosporangium cerinum TaxID=1434730 RepID=A0ABV9WD03_9ACTN
MRITGKLMVLVVVPLVAVVAFAGLALVSAGGQALRADRLRSLVVAGEAAGDLVSRLQAERVAAVEALVGRPTGAVDAYLQKAAATDAAADRFRGAQSQLSQVPGSMQRLLDQVDSGIGQLAALRARVSSGKGAASALVFAYRILIADLVSYRESMAQAGGAPADIADRIRAAAALSRAAEFVGLQQVAALRATESEQLTPAAYQDITAARTGYAEAALTFDALAAPQWLEWLDGALTGDDVVAAQRLEDTVARIRPGARLGLDRAGWTSAMSARIEQLHQVEIRIGAEIVADVTRLRDDQRWVTAVEFAAVLAAVGAVIGLALWLGRPMIRGLRRLRDTARRVARQTLPAEVARLADHEVLGGLTPEQFADSTPAPVDVRGRDELAEVGAAFNAVHREAVRVAAEQATTRVGIAAMFESLARRGQGLAGQLLAELDRQERGEEDPDRLAQLFRLDHLAALLTRTNDSLLVLGGGASARPRRQDEPVIDVLRAAQGQVEQYTRIEFGFTDDLVAIRAAAVDDLVKLLAELMDNGCSYSQAAVTVSARLLTDRVVVQIVDAGIGIDADRRRALNERLASDRGPLDLAAVRAMGLTVVGRLAARHGIRVELRPGQPGTIVDVTVPVHVFTIGTTPRRALDSGHAPVAALTGARVSGAVGAGPVAGAQRRDPSAPPAAPLFQVDGPAAVPQPRPATGPPSIPVAGPRPAAADLADTVETRLPIFEAVQGSWFVSAPASAPAVDADGEPVPRPAEPWQMTADTGWQAAAAAAQPAVAAITRTGLPQRNPMANLVPGSVELGGQPAVPAAEYRDPQAVAASLAAYGRGLARNSRAGAHIRPTSNV